MTQEEIDNEYRQFQVNRLTTQQDLLSFYGLLFMSNNPKHYETWLSKVNRFYDDADRKPYDLALLIAKVGSLLEKVYAS